jgi:hypothetical protein
VMAQLTSSSGIESQTSSPIVDYWLSGVADSRPPPVRSKTLMKDGLLCNIKPFHQPISNLDIPHTTDRRNHNIIIFQTVSAWIFFPSY